MIRLVEVAPDNWRLNLHVAESQKRFVSNSAGILARAYAYRNSRSNAYVVYNDETPVGMALYYDCEDFDAYNFSQFFIDERYQGKGYGLEATKQILEKMKCDGKYDKVVLCYVEGDEVAKNMYLKLGFHLTGDCDDDEIVMEKSLR